MQPENQQMKAKNPIVKSNMHERNIHRNGYDFKALIPENPILQDMMIQNAHGTDTIDFAEPDSVRALNTALLKSCYGIQQWSLPPDSLCPAVPGRADYIHYIADLLAASNAGVIPTGVAVTGLDIGTGASCIYPLLGNAIYGWHFVGTDIDADALANCEQILTANPLQAEAISLQQQPDPRSIFKDIILPEDRFAFTICNPPFHASKEEANNGTRRKINNLGTGKENELVLNFAGRDNELVYEGGELTFITRMIYESARYPNQCLWYTTLVSKKESLRALYKILEKVNAATVHTIDMGQGQKNSRIIAWTFLSDMQVANWKF